MTFMNAKDDATADCAYALSEAGQPAPPSKSRGR
jgi:hypothetical protein